MIKFLKKSYFVLLPLTLTVLMLALRFIRYGAVDDVLLYDMANSFPSNAHSEHLMFVSVIFGYILKILYTLLPVLNWFSILYLVFFNLSFITYFKVLEKHGSNIVFISILSFIEIYLLMRISFTVIAFTCSSAGILWALDNVDKLSKDNIKHIVYSFFLFVIGFMMRSDSVFLCIMLIFVPSFCFAGIKKRSSIAVIVVVILLAGIANYGIIGVQKVYKSTIPDETYYNEFQQYRSAASDEGKLNYKKHKDAFKNADISKNDLSIFKQYVYIDKEAYSSDKLKVISEARDFKDRYNLNLKSIIKNAYTLENNKALNTIFYYAFVSVLLFLLFKKKRLELFSSALFVTAAETYLFVRRRGVARVVHPIALIGIVLLLFIVLDETNFFKELKLIKKLDIKKLSTAVCCIAVALSVSFSAVTLYYYNKRFHNYSEVIACAEEDTEHLYLSLPRTRDKLMDHHLTLLSSSYQKIPIYVVSGDWWAYSYYWYDLMEQLNLSQYNDNAINAILEDNVRLMIFNTNTPEQLIKFYREHYHLTVEYQVVNYFPDYNIGVYEFYIQN